MEIIRDVLEVCLSGASKTRIVYRANLNFSRLERYLGLLLGLGWLAVEVDASGGVVFRTTEGGREFLNGCLRAKGLRGLEGRLV
ncbi:MAG: winged helix-turn-helix domain-containing protein, partial [Candidatus Bathyarchaeia archaeon]